MSSDSPVLQVPERVLTAYTPTYVKVRTHTANDSLRVGLEQVISGNSNLFAA